MTIRIDLRGSKELQAALRNMSDDVRDAASAVVINEAQRLRGEIVESIKNGPANGTTYYRIPGEKYMTIRAGSSDGPPVAFIPGGGNHNLSRTHTASGPWQPPMSDTGRYANSIVFDREGDLTAIVHPSGKKMQMLGAWLEYGTKRMSPRPHFRPAAHKRQPIFLRNMETALARVIR